MKRIHYAGAQFSTSDELAHELIAYASELARRNTADVVLVPGVDDGGVATTYEVLLGPASQLVVASTDRQETIDTADALSEVRRRHEELVPAPFVPLGDETHFGDW